MMWFEDKTVVFEMTLLRYFESMSSLKEQFAKIYFK